MSTSKKDAQRELDRLRLDRRSFEKDTDQYKRRLVLEMLLDQHLLKK